MKQKVLVSAVILFLGFLSPSFAQEKPTATIAQLQERVDSLRSSLDELTIEVNSLSPTLTASQEEIEAKVNLIETNFNSLQEYIHKLTENIDKFSKDMSQQVDIKVKVGGDKVVALSPVSKNFTKIDTNGGIFLLAVNKFQRTEEGYRVALNVGNPNLAKYTGLKFKLNWGKKWDPNSLVTKYEDWRASLIGAEYEFAGQVPAGEWTEVTLDLTPPGQNQLEYIECEMEVTAVEFIKPPAPAAKKKKK